ncbi:MAG: endonuclease/exonuclease/phosphatase family protein, partial [bacterium]|nr:endonuclease/exonuclease/phosphatase family protein [bacterium]
MKKILRYALVLALAIPFVCINAQEATSKKGYVMYGVAFYNLENLFDTINTNGTYDLEFSPNGARQW